MRLISELKRRNVLRMAVLYVVAAWLVMQVAGVLIDLGALPEWAGPWVLAVLAIGLPIALIVSWFYEITPEGLALEKDVPPADVAAHAGSRRVDFIIIAMLSAAVMLFAYEKWWPEGPMENSIAVLPFANLSGDPEQEYFSDGISEELLNLLAKVPELDVRARSSSFSFKGKDMAIPAIADQLNVAFILEGSVRKAGNRLRITAQLIEARKDSHLWSEVYDRDASDVFAVQDEIAAAIGDALKLWLVAGDAGPPSAVKAANIDAYDAYLKGRELFRRRGAEDVQAAIRAYQRALRLDDDFAPAHAQLAIAIAMRGRRGEISLEEVMRTATPHLERAQALGADLAEVHAGWGELASLNGDHEAAVQHHRNAVAANPRYGDALNWLLLELRDLGRYQEADAVMHSALAADPLDYVLRFNYTEWLAETGRIDEARKLADRLLEEDARWGNWAHANLMLFYEGKLADGLSYALKIPNRWLASRVLAWTGEYEEARRIDPDTSFWVDTEEGNWEAAVLVWQERLKLSPNDAETLAIAGDVLYQSGRPEEALPILERALGRTPEGRPIAGSTGLKVTMQLAWVRRQLGDEEGAQSAARTVRDDIAALRAAGRNFADLRVAEAMLAIFDRDLDRAIDSLTLAVEHGLRDPSFHVAGTFLKQLEEKPRFVALREQLERLLDEEHEKVLQLICSNNPAPDEWRPLSKTCAGVVKQ